MNIEKVEMILSNMELMIQSLREELKSNEQNLVYEEIAPYLQDDVDEYYDPSEEI